MRNMEILIIKRWQALQTELQRPAQGEMNLIMNRDQIINRKLNTVLKSLQIHPLE